MNKMVAMAGLVLVGLTGVANADAPGGWDQYNARMAKHAVKPVAQVQQPVPQVDVYMNNQRQGTWLFQANPNQGGND